MRETKEIYSQETIRKVQQRLLEMAVTIRNILESNYIPYIITYGSLLGAIRHSGFIPWDDDFDFYLFEDSYDYAIDTLKSHLPVDLFLENEDSEPKYFHDWAHVKDTNSFTTCDLFPSDGAYSHHGISIDLYKMYATTDRDERLLIANNQVKYYTRKYSKGLLDQENYEHHIKALTDIIEEQKSVVSNWDAPVNDVFTCFGYYNKEFLYKHEMFPLRKYTFEGEDFFGPNNAHVFLTRCYNNYLTWPKKEKRSAHYSSVKFLKEVKG